MDIIIKPTQLCNFNCDFCSSNNISNNSNRLLDHNNLFNLFDKYKNDLNTIIVNGGDPLMAPPDYYWKIIDYLDNNHLKTSISFTTNLWDFYIRPDKWKDLFNNKHCYICTSFQYGNKRKLKNGLIYTEEIFKKVIEKFYSYFNYIPHFISVIDNDNYKYAIKTVELAKELNTECKLNPVVMAGKSLNYFPFYKMINIYINIIKKNLEKYEYNTKEIRKLLLNSQKTTCPYNRDCYKSIRCISPENYIHSCGFLNDNHLKNISVNNKTYELSKYNEHDFKKDNLILQPKCLGCNLFKLCNGCYMQIKSIKENNDIESHCINMKKIERELLNVYSIS